MDTTADYRAVSTDQAHWYAQVWSKYANSYVDIRNSPAFRDAASAIVWAMYYSDHI